jgi:uncharacterized protein YdeI (YjbR/CyaY-like superfamily)
MTDEAMTDAAMGDGPETGPDGRPMAGPFDRAAWRAWLIEHHARSSGVHLVSWRRGAGRTSVPYEEAVEEALCVGWVDSVAGRLDETRSLQWFSPRRPRSGWARSNKERVERLTAAGLMLPAGLAAIEEAKRTGTWTMLDDVENLVVPEDLAAALDASPPARQHWEAFPRSPRRAILEWIVQARRPETRARRIAQVAQYAARNERPPQFRPRD